MRSRTSFAGMLCHITAASATPMNRSPASLTTSPKPNGPTAVVPKSGRDACWSSFTFSPYLALGNRTCLRATGPSVVGDLCEKDFGASREEIREVVGCEVDSVKNSDEDCEKGGKVELKKGCKVDFEEGKCRVDCVEGCCNVDSVEGFEVDCEEGWKPYWKDGFEGDFVEGNCRVDCEERNCRVDCEESSTVDREEDCAGGSKEDCKEGRGDDCKVANGGNGFEGDCEKVSDDDCRTSVRLAYTNRIHGLLTVMISVKLAEGPSAFGGRGDDSVFGDEFSVVATRKSHRCATFTVIDEPAAAAIITSSSKHEVTA